MVVVAAAGLTELPPLSASMTTATLEAGAGGAGIIAVIITT